MTALRFTAKGDGRIVCNGCAPNGRTPERRAADRRILEAAGFAWPESENHHEGCL